MLETEETLKDKLGDIMPNHYVSAYDIGYLDEFKRFTEGITKLRGFIKNQLNTTRASRIFDFLG